eukprot:15457187-Alexandrium_andersonii.AAC.1
MDGVTDGLASEVTNVDGESDVMQMDMYAHACACECARKGLGLSGDMQLAAQPGAKTRATPATSQRSRARRHARTQEHRCRANRQEPPTEALNAPG